MSTEDRTRYTDCLREAADLLEAQGANRFRIAAYRKAADAVRDQEADIARIVEQEGTAGLEKLPHIGRGIAAALAEMVQTGRWMQLERLRGDADPVSLFTAVPGLGHRLAERIHEELHIDTLEALELAAYDGRLEHVTGVGPRRAATIRANLHAMLSRARAHHRAPEVDAQRGPGVDVLLGVDKEYRDKAAHFQLPMIAPKRFNPSGEAWLPVLHASRDGWHFTVLFSNTAQAHQLGRTKDWVVIYFYDDEHAEGQHTVVTETRGPLVGRRVVRGREADCRAFYAR